MNHAASDHATGPPDDAAVALKGASLAFKRLPARGDAISDSSPPPPPSVLSSSSAPRKEGESTSRSHTPPAGAALHPGHHHQDHAHDGDSPTRQASSAAARLPQLKAGSSSTSQRLDPKSPSFIAATLAASRSVSPGSLAATRRPSSSNQGQSSAALVPRDAVDSASIPPTGNLISMFENARDASLHGIRPAAAAPARESKERSGSTNGPIKNGMSPEPSARATARSKPRSAAGLSVHLKNPPTPPARNSKSTEKISAMPMPKPQQFAASAPRPSLPKQPRTDNIAAAQKPRRPALSRNSSSIRANKSQSPSAPSVVSRSTPEVLSPKPVRPIKPALAPPVSNLSTPVSVSGTHGIGASLPPPPPKTRGSHRYVVNQSTGNGSTHVSPERPSPVTPLTEFGLPIVPPMPPETRPRPVRRKQTPPPLIKTRGPVVSAPASPELAPVRPQRGLAAVSTSSLPLENLTSAMMASSLANSRLTPHNTGPSLPPPSLPKRQKSPRLLHTLRQPQSQTEQDPERSRIAHRHKLASNKHAHHEGARKRWRDQITQRERKRYEAVWASNRGYLLQDDSVPADSGLNVDWPDCVVNVVVREIWKRSRLPVDELMEVWELVDRHDAGVLTRQEFIVGMWLIDQRLKGRKLPVRVSDSVWDSAHGVRLLKPKPKSR